MERRVQRGRPTRPDVGEQLLAAWLGQLRTLHLPPVYQEPFIGSDTKALEIGCGGGAWSKAIAGLSPEELCCVDVLSAEEARFWEYVGRRPGVRHIRVDDLFLNDLPDGHFDYFFSFGCFCHLSPQIIEEYLSHIVKKLGRRGQRVFDGGGPTKSTIGPGSTTSTA